MINRALEEQSLRERLLGRAFGLQQIQEGLEIGRDLQFKLGPSGRDFTWVQGVDALSQALILALTTALGTDVFNTQFGFDGLNALAEETDRFMMRERIRIAIIRVLQKEPRVLRILDVRFSDDSPLPKDLPQGQIEQLRRVLNVVVSFQAVSGQELSINLGKVATNG